MFKIRLKHKEYYLSVEELHVNIALSVMRRVEEQLRGLSIILNVEEFIKANNLEGNKDVQD